MFGLVSKFVKNMKGKGLYPSVHHFLLKKELPYLEVGAVMQIIDTADCECIIGKSVSGRKIEFPIEVAIECHDWFEAISIEEHGINFRKNSIKYLMEEKGRSLDDAIRIFDGMWEENII
jgi:hypothetical protein